MASTPDRWTKSSSQVPCVDAPVKKPHRQVGSYLWKAEGPGTPLTASVLGLPGGGSEGGFSPRNTKRQ